ncbi:MAG: hypothetical protein V5A57_03060 [Candidatus Paceibacterota bacterium]
MSKVDYNIEYAHIFTSESRFTSEQERSVEEAKDLIEELEDEGDSYTLSVLLDDYSPSFSYLDAGHFLFKLREKELPPNYVGYESRLVAAAEDILDKIPDDKKEVKKLDKDVSLSKNVTFLHPDHEKIEKIGLKEVTQFKHEGEYDTSLLIAAWYLYRLGAIEIPSVIRRTVFSEAKPFTGEKIINILPEKHKRVEEKVQRLLKSIPEYSSYVDDIEYRYFK